MCIDEKPYFPQQILVIRTSQHSMDRPKCAIMQFPIQMFPAFIVCANGETLLIDILKITYY